MYLHDQQWDAREMKRMVDPAQKPLFDPEMGYFSPSAYRRLQKGWQGIFRRCLLSVMPAQELGEEFSETMGRPTKELYAMAGLVTLAEMHGWTSQEAAEAFVFNQAVQYALNAGHVQVELSARALERYQRIFREKELGQVVLERVTRALIDELQLEVDVQRLDSTHVFSGMAEFGRTRLMATCIRRFLVQLKRHHNDEYAALDAAVRERGLIPDQKVFGRSAPKAEARVRLRLQLAEDMRMLMDRYADHPRIPQMTSYQNMLRVFSEQCEIVGGKIAVRTKTGSRSMQNPSDPDATFDGHKGKGYQLQLSETCHPDNPVQMVTCAIPQTAADEDGDALPQVVEKLENADLKPTELLADTLYGSDNNQQLCETNGIELIAPVRGKPPREGYVPKNEVQQRLARRREIERSEEWLARYRPRAGIEGTNSGLKRRMQMGKLKVRGRKSVYHVLWLKVTGWNVFRAVDGLARMAAKPPRPPKQARKATESSLFADLLCLIGCQGLNGWPLRWYSSNTPLRVAA